MGVKVLGADTAPEQVKVFGSDEASLPKVDNKTKPTSEQGVEEPVTFGMVDNLHGANGEAKETNHAAVSYVPEDAVDEWPAPKQIHTFYCVKFRSYEDPKIRAKVEQAEKDLQKKNQARFQITEALKAKRSERTNVISQLKPLTSEDKQYRMAIDGKRKEMGPLTAALGQLRSANSSSRDKGVVVCSSEEDLDDLIHSLHYRIQHESNTLVEEKQLLKEIKQLESTREKVIANAAMRVKIQDSLGQKEAIQDQVKLIGVDMDGVRKDQQTVRTKIKHLEEELKTIDDKISSLQEELAAVTEKRDKAYETLSELRKARDETNAPFYQNRSLLNNIKVLAAKKNITAVEELCHNEVEKFMTDWSSSKAFRDDYERRILPSLDIRQLSRDGRMRNPDERPIISEPQQPANELETEPIKTAAKRVKEDGVPPARHDIFAARKPQEEMNIVTEAEQKGKSRRVEDREEDTYEIGKAQELPKGKEINLAELREIKREEELAKAKLAMERKKKLAEKAAAKAEARAQKEAEKRMKDKEKRAKKKTGIQTILSAEQDNTDALAVEPEETEVKSDAPVPANAKEHKEKIKYRARPKVSDSLPKVILKRKKSHSYWSWAAPAAILAVAFAVVGWYYFGMN